MTTRRDFIKCAGGGLVLAIAPSPIVLGAANESGRKALADATSVAPFIQPFLAIGTDGTVTVYAKHLEMGQGIWAGLASIVAEELDADWAQIRVEGAPANQALYKNTLFGFQSTGGSTSISNSWDQLRKAGAAARAMLAQAAALKWNLPVADVDVVRGVVSSGVGKSAKRATFGELAEAASKLDVPTMVVLKKPAEFRYLGKNWPRQDSREKSTGKAVFGIDIKLPNLKIAVVERAPRFGAVLKSFEAKDALAVKGVVDVVAVPSGVAVLADSTWTALSARKLLKIEWDESKAEKRSTSQMMVDFRASAKNDPANVCLERGDVEKGLAGAVTMLEAEFDFPYLAHAPMEPLCAAGQISGTGAERRCTIWGGLQNQTSDHKNVARILDLPLEKITLNTIYAGGSFGRRATFNSDWIGELAEILKATGGKYPVKVFRTREDDISGGYFRPMSYHRIKAGLDAKGDIAGLHHTIVTQSFLFAFKGKVDPTAVDGTAVARYDIPNAKLDWINPPSPVTVWTFRALSYNHTTLAKEIFMDELARRANQDPLAYRMKYLANQPRQMAVLKLAAEKAGWGNKLKEGRAAGLAVQEAQSSFVAMVAEVAIVNRQIVVERVVCAIDCGFAINPDIVKAQMEGGIGFSLAVALYGKITLKDGRVEQSNFSDYPVLRMSEMPKKIEVYIVDSSLPPTGVGEPGSVLIGAAVANAVVAITGKPVRSFPLADSLA